MPTLLTIPPKLINDRSVALSMSLVDALLSDPSLDDEHICSVLSTTASINPDAIRRFTRVACNMIRFTGRLMDSCVAAFLQCDTISMLEKPREDEGDHKTNRPIPLSRQWILERRIRRGMTSATPGDIPPGRVSDLIFAAQVSLAAYQAPEIVKENESFIDSGLSSPTFINSHPQHGTRALLVQQPKTRTVFIGFRGTTSLTDIKYDLDFRMVHLTENHPHVLVHAGFKEKFKSVKQQLVNELLSRASEFDRIVFTGHSLGGALATVSSPILAGTLLDKKVHCITFGSPRVGNGAFTNFFTSNVHSSVRMTTDFDPVPSLPFETFYEHVQPAISVTESNEVLVVPEVPIGSRLLNAFEDLDFDRSIRDHDMRVYYDRLQSTFISTRQRM